MKQFFLMLIAALGFGTFLNAQEKTQDPVEWHVQLKAIDEHTFQLTAEAKMKDGFHIWALDAGGDGSLINTEIVLEDDAIQWIDKQWQVNKKPKTETYEFIDGEVHYFEKQVKLSRTFKSDSKPKITGTITYQSCNEAMCFPPKDLAFEVESK